SNNRHIKPGVLELLGILNKRGIYTGLLTGNIEEGAWFKLKSFNISQYFTFGGFSSDDEERDKLLPIALKKLYDKFKLNIQPEESLVIGDTPRDVTCAKPHGAKVLGVATGSYSCEELKSYGADWVLDDLSNTDIIKNEILYLEE
ncbi:MAG: HAD family hydrolase, partial [Nitrospirae bacterium]